MDRADVLAALAGYPAALVAAAGLATGRPTPPGEWSPGEVVRHLIAVEIDVHQARLADLATHVDPRWSWAEPGPWRGEPALTLDELTTRFADLRQTTLETLAALDEAGWARTGTHEQLGAWDVLGLVRNAVDHDREHLNGLA